MCDHDLYCDTCQETAVEAELFKKRSLHYRQRCIALNEEKEEVYALANKARALQAEMEQMKAAHAREIQALQRKHDKQVSSLKKSFAKKENAHTQQMARMREMREKDAAYVIQCDKMRTDAEERCKRTKEQKRAVEEAQSILKKTLKDTKHTANLLLAKAKSDETLVNEVMAENVELKERIKSLASFDDNVQQMSEQVDKLRAVNHHLATSAAVNKREVEKLSEAWMHAQQLCHGLKQQCDIFAQVFKLACEHKDTKKRLVAILDSLKIEGTDLLRG